MNNNSYNLFTIKGIRSQSADQHNVLLDLNELKTAKRVAKRKKHSVEIPTSQITLGCTLRTVHVLYMYIPTYIYAWWFSIPANTRVREI